MTIIHEKILICLSAVVVLAVCFVMSRPLASSGNQQSTDDGSRRSSDRNRSRERLTNTRQERFEQSLYDPEELIALMPELTKTSFFNNRKNYDRLIASLEGCSKAQLAQLLSCWPMELIDDEGKSLDIPSLQTFVRDARKVFIRGAGSDESVKADVELASLIEPSSYAKGYWLRLIISKTEAFSAEDFAHIVDSGKLSSQDKSMLRSGFLMCHHDDLKAGNLDVVENYLNVISDPEVMMHMAVDVINYAPKDKAYLKALSVWIGGQEGDLLEAADRRLIQEAISLDATGIAYEHIDELKANSNTRRAQLTTSFLKVEMARRKNEDK